MNIKGMEDALIDLCSAKNKFEDAGYTYGKLQCDKLRRIIEGVIERNKEAKNEYGRGI